MPELTWAASADGGGQHWAFIVSLIEIWKLADVITHIVDGHPKRHIDELLPRAYPTAPALKEVATKSWRTALSPRQNTA